MEQACSSAAFALPVWPAALQLTKLRTVRRSGPRVSHQGGPPSSVVLQNAKWMGRDSRGNGRTLHDLLYQAASRNLQALKRARDQASKKGGTERCPGL